MVLDADIQSGKSVFFVWDPNENWKVLSVSANVYAIYGYTTQEFLEGKIVYADLVHPEDLSRVRQEVKTATETGQIEFSHEIYRIKDSNGSYHYVYDHTKIIRDEVGNVLEYRGYINDETHDLSLKSLPSMLLQGANLGVWDWYPKTKKVIYDDNWAAMLGYKLSEIAPSLEAWESKVHPDDLQACWTAINAHIDGKTDFYEHIHRLKHKDGSWRFVMDRGRIVSRDEYGAPIRFTGTSTDITALKNEQQQLELQHTKTESLLDESYEIIQRYKSFLELSSDAILIFSAANGKLIDYSRLAQQELGYSYREMASLTVFDWDKELDEAMFDEVKNDLDKQSVIQLQRIHTRKNGTTYISSIRARKIKGFKEDLIISTSRNISAEIKNNNKLKTYKKIIDVATNGVVITNQENIIIEVNKAFEDLSGYPAEVLIGQNPRINKSLYTNKDFYKSMWDDIQHHDAWTGRLTNKRNDGNLYTCLVNITAVRDDDGEVIQYTAFYSDITQMVTSEEELTYLSTHDTLTGLENRLAFDTQFKHAHARASRNSNPLAVLFIDIDDFKGINDSYGHLVGDLVLKEVARRLMASSRSGDLVARFAGDEFILLIEDIKSNDAAEYIVHKVMEAFTPIFQLEGCELSISISIGISVLEEEQSASELLNEADQAMYKAKLQTGNSYCFF